MLFFCLRAVKIPLFSDFCAFGRLTAYIVCDFLKLIYDVNSFSVIDHAKYLIKDSLKCDYVYLNYNKREHKIIAVKNEYICNELKHGYISNRFVYNGDDQDIQHKINYVNDYHNILDNLLDIINSNKYLKHIFSTLMKDNILYLN